MVVFTSPKLAVIEISRLAPQLSTRQQKLALELIRDMADRKETDEA